jgi:putative ABC transport system substrate-binding protein
MHLSALALVLILLAGPFAVEAQQPTRVVRVGWLSGTLPTDNPPLREAFMQRLRDHGYVQGRNLVFEGRWAEGKLDRLPALAAELAGLQVDAIVTVGPTATYPAKKVTTTIPIVFVGVSAPVESGLVASLARPGGNVTGLSFDVGPELSGKRLELLKEVVPRASRVAYLRDPTIPGATATLQATEAAARALGVTLQPLEMRGPDDLEPAFTAMAKERADAVLIGGGPIASFHRARIAELAAKHRIAAIYGLRGFVDSGGLMSYGPSLADLFRRAADYVDNILKGTKPANLPVEQPTKFELVINRRTAKALGLTIPPALLLKVDHVIE